MITAIKRFDLAKWLMAFLIILLVLQLVNRALLCCSYNSDLGGIETTFIYYIQRALDHRVYYQSPEVPPYYLHQYQPIYTFVASKAVCLFGVTSTDVHGIYVGARVINLIANLCTVLLLFMCLRKLLACSVYISVGLSILLFLSFFVHNYAARADSLKTLFVVAAIYSAVSAYKSLQRSRTRWIVFSAFFLALATYTKQDAFSYIILFPASLWLIKEKSLAVQLLGFAGVMLIAGLAILWLIYGFEYWNNVVNGLKQGISWHYFIKIFSKALMPVLLMVMLLIMLYFISNTADKKDALFFFLLTFFTFFIAVLSLLKWGAATVYFTDFCVFGFLLMGAVLQNARKNVVIISLLLVLGLLAYDLRSNYFINKIIYSPSAEIAYKERFNDLNKLRPQLIQGLDSPGIICLNKELTNHLYPYCLFSTFEHEFPQYIYCAGMKMVSAPNIIFDYPRLEICEQTRIIILHKGCEDLPPPLHLECLEMQGPAYYKNLAIYKIK